MDGERFDALARAIDLHTPRRAALGWLGGGLTALLTSLGIEDSEAKKRKKKKCKPCRKRKKGKCKKKKPDGTPCGGENVCLNGQCVPPTCDPPCVAPRECVAGACSCPIGTIPCGDECIDDALCCTDDDCDRPKICVDDTCICPADTVPCGTDCFTGNECCAASDCGGDLICDDGFCLCPGESFACGDDQCCSLAEDEICVFTGGELACQGGGCPESDICNQAVRYGCDIGCICVTSVEEATVCSTAFIRCPETACTTDAECTELSDEPAICVAASGIFCPPFCGGLAAFCVTSTCESGVPRRANNRRGPALADTLRSAR